MMHKIKQSTAAKTFALILTALLCAAVLVCLFAFVLLEKYGAYSWNYESARINVLAEIIDDRAWRAGNEYFYFDVSPDSVNLGSGFAFCLYDNDRKLIYDGLEGKSYSFETGMMPLEEGYVRGYLLSDIPESDYELTTALRQFDSFYSLRFIVPIVGIVCAALAVLLFVFLMSAAGHRPGGEIRGSFLHRVPFDLLSAAVIAAVMVCTAIFFECLDWDSSMRHIIIQVVFAALSFIIAGFISLVWFMTFAVHIKMRDTLKSCLSIRVLLWFRHHLEKIFDAAKGVFKALPLIPRAAAIIAAVLLIEFLWFFITGCDPEGMLFGWFIERAVLVCLTLYTLLGMKKLSIAAKEIADGKLAYKVNSARLYGPLREHAENLNRISDGLNSAVNERMKNERFKTELITNVSHDIKTPLTSIINYTDLLEKEQPESEKMREYIEVISRQSQKLKKLTEDLIEASKASSGVLPVSLVRTDVTVLLEQTQGEYADRLAAAGLEFIVGLPATPLFIQADARHIWRVFDNLMNNIVKYSRKGTRVYLSAGESGGRAVITFRNISESMLNISPEKLMERFVRADEARHTEGSGLGLSIANSLTELQGGTMQLSIDGDLFKVVLSFPSDT